MIEDWDAAARRLKFPPDMERLFQEDYRQRTVRLVRLTLTIGVFLYLAFAALDYIDLPQTYQLAWLFRGIALAYMLLVLAFGFSEKTQPYIQILSATYLILAGLAIDAMIAFSHPQELGYSTYYVGAMVVAFGGFIFLQVQFRYALFAAMVTMIGYLCSAIFVQDLLTSNLVLFVNNTFFFVTTVIIGAIGCYLIEYYRRLDFIQRQLLAQQNSDLDAYAHTVAHDLKNPLGLIVSYVDIIETRFSDSLPEDVRSRLSIVSKTSRSMTGIINGLLLLASIRRQHELLIAELDMDAIVTLVLERLKTERDTSQAQVVRSAISLRAMGYQSWVEEIWMNLLSNAIKYGGTPPVIEIGAEPQEGMIRFYVKDNGTGLSADKKELLFKEFSRLDADLKQEGHGLGLSIVQRIVTRLGGEVWVESEEKQGSCFYFTLPAATP